MRRPVRTTPSWIAIACCSMLIAGSVASVAAQSPSGLPLIEPSPSPKADVPRRLPPTHLGPRRDPPEETPIEAPLQTGDEDLSGAKGPAPKKGRDGEALRVPPVPESLPGRVPPQADEALPPVLPPPPPESSFAVAANADPAYWWDPLVAGSVMPGAEWISFDLATLLTDALRHSPRVVGIGMQAETAWAAVVQEDAAFDMRLLSESVYGRTSDPVGNSLITGGPPLLRESDWTSRFGVRRKTRWGGKWDASQQLGLRDSNSSFFTPPNQGNARMTISLVQPLLAGAGRLYNERLVLDAQFEADVSWQEILEEVQTNLRDLMIAYWQLYYERCRVVQQRDLLERGRTIERLVEMRSDYDTGRIEQLRVQEHMARRRNALIRAETDLQNEQARLALLVGSPRLTERPIDEMIPRERPHCPTVPIDPRHAVVTGLHHRPDVALAAAQVEQAALGVEVTRNQLHPQLNALVEMYVAGLNGDSDVGGSIGDQFTEGQPGFSAGLQYELPVGRRSARADHRAARAELLRKTEAMRSAVLTARTEIAITVREVDTASRLLQTRRDALEAAAAEEHYLQRRWELLGTDTSSVGLILEDLLDAQQTRTEAEKDLVGSKVEYLQSLARLQTAMGTLLGDAAINPVFDPSDFGVRFERQATPPFHEK